MSHTGPQSVLKKGKFEIMDLLAVVCELSFKPAFALEKWEAANVMAIVNKILQGETSLEMCAQEAW